MKRVHLIAAALMLAGLSTFSASAQTTPTGVGANGSGTSSPAAQVVPDIKIAFINTDIFRDQKAGIKHLLKAIETFHREMQALQNEIKTMQARLKEIASSESSNEKRVAFEKLDDEIKRKSLEGNAAYDKRSQELMNPVSADIGKYLIEFAAKHGIAMILDSSKLDGAYLVGTPERDIQARDVTQSFIAEYNSKNR